jgi:hypothetical protein
MLQTAPPTRLLPPIAPGDRIRVTQRIDGRDRTWSTSLEGVVESRRAEPTGSWYAHGKNDKLWLVRIRLRKPDGEVTSLIVDHNTRVELLPPLAP